VGPLSEGCSRFIRLGREIGLLWAALVLGFPFFSCSSHDLRLFKGSVDPPVVQVLFIPPYRNLEASSLIIFPFSGSDELNRLSYALALRARERLLQARFLKTMEVSGACPRSSAEAIALGRKERCDLILLVSVEEFAFGGLRTGSRVGLSLRISDARTTVPLWHLRGHIESRSPRPSRTLFLKTGGNDPSCPYGLAVLLLEELLKALLNPNLRSPADL
jgi:hypothetical protein